MRTILLAHATETMARTKRLSSAQTYLKKLEAPAKQSDQSTEVAAMLRRMAANTGG